MPTDQAQNNNRYVSPERYAPHLSEFYPIVNSDGRLPKGDSQQQEQQEQIHLQRPNDILKSPLHSSRSSFYRIRRPSSVRSGASTINDLQTLITKKDMKKTLDAMQELSQHVESYARQLVSTSQRASLVASSLEEIARLKGCRDDTAEKFLNSSGLFHLLANHQRIMSQCITTALGEKLEQHMEGFNLKYATQESHFKQAFHEQTMKLKLQEKYNIKLSKRKIRNLVSYRENLQNLQTQLDDLESLKHDYYQDSYELVQSCCGNILKDVATVSRAQVEICENIARKGWSGGGLDDLIVDAEDPFNKDRNHEDNSEGESEETYDQQTPKNTFQQSPVASFSTPVPITEQSDSPQSSNKTSNETQETFDNSFSLPLPGTRGSFINNTTNKHSGEGDRADKEGEWEEEGEEEGEGEEETARGGKDGEEEEGTKISQHVLEGLDDLQIRDTEVCDQSSTLEG